MSVIVELDRRSKLATVGGERFLKEIAALPYLSAHAGHHTAIVVAKAPERDVLRATTATVDDLRLGTFNRGNTLDHLERARETLTPPATEATSWLEDAAHLLAEPDPGPTPLLGDDLLVEGTVAAIQGPHNVGKTWVELELAISIVSGRPERTPERLDGRRLDGRRIYI